MTKPTKILFIGLPSSGKTTFLAALWYLVDGINNTKLSLSRLTGDQDYLNNIRGKWLSCSPLERTKLTNEKITNMLLFSKETNKNIDLIIPDLSGETYNEQWATRCWTKEFQNLVNSVNGGILFIHPNEIVEPIRIDQTSIIVDEILDHELSENEETANSTTEWDQKNAPTQVKLVELLQFFKQSNKCIFPFKLTIIISAWDLITNKKNTPNKWLEKRLPLLHQFLLSNSDSYPYKIYGISAQGGDYSSETSRLACINEPRDRITLIEQNKVGYDLTIPIYWLIENNE